MKFVRVPHHLTSGSEAPDIPSSTKPCGSGPGVGGSKSSLPDQFFHDLHAISGFPSTPPVDEFEAANSKINKSRFYLKMPHGGAKPFTISLYSFHLPSLDKGVVEIEPMPQCLFCPTEGQELTDEHIFPAALGGHLKLKNADCTECNGGFSREFEQTIAGRLVDFRRILVIPDRRGNLPELAVKVKVDGKQLDGKLLRSGDIQLAPVFTKNIQDGITEIIGEHVTEWQKAKFRGQAKEKGMELVEHTTPGREAEVSISGHLEFIDSAEMLRTITKIAYMTLAFRMGIPLAMRDVFNDCRNYIKAGGTPKVRLFLNERFFEACAPNLHQL